MQNNKDQRTSGPHRRFWIIGAGHFGRIAARRIRQRIPGAETTVVDAKPPEGGIDADRFIHEEGVAWLVRNLSPTSPVDMIVPAIPVHVAAGWLCRRLSDQFQKSPIDVFDEWRERLPNPIPGMPGQYFVSHADFICPDNCPEPEAICTHTGQPRPLDLFRLLAGLTQHGLVPIVLRSYQLLPGVGGLLPADLFNALAKAADHAAQPLMIATACRCHGVVDFMRMVPGSDANRPPASNRTPAAVR